MSRPHPRRGPVLLRRPHRSDDACPDPADPDAHVTAALNYDLMRSLKQGTPWLPMEQAPSAVSRRPANVPKKPGPQRLWSLQAVARGADGVLPFQWRASRTPSATCSTGPWPTPEDAPATGTDLLTGTELHGSVRLAPLGAAVVRTPAAPAPLRTPRTPRSPA
ncbi:beta-galactosidase [Streptomyces sp. KL116D]|uniref:beta-galactosidase n=1 Tax=Streptomyces sp. KL116D TaxID=3045152 RepID=UPI0035568640